MRAFVTGASGFIGSRVVAKLCERGYDVIALSRSGRLASQGVSVVPGDINDRAVLRDAMAGCDLVFHMAGWYKIGATDTRSAHTVNVEGTRTVLGLAAELNIPKIIYTSTVAVFGDTHGVLADESYVAPHEDLVTEYDRTKWQAHYEVAVPLQRGGAPIVIVQPGVAFGPGDPSIMGAMMRAFYLGLLPFVPGPESVYCFTPVDDVAEGHILAAEKGRPGESYILAGPALSLGTAFDVWSDVTGLSTPALRVPGAALRPFAPVVGAINRVAPLPELYREEALRMMGVTYLAQSGKARRELGWQTHPLPDAFAEAFHALARSDGPAPRGWAARNRTLLAGLGVVAALAALLGRPKRK